MSQEFEEKVIKILGELNTKIDAVDKRLTSKIDAHSVELADIKRYLVNIEDKLSNQIPALFDGYSMNLETTNQIKSRQEATDKKVEINSFKISELEKTSRIHDKELKRILAN